MTDPLGADNKTVTIGLLLETAQSHQELAEDSLKRLQSHAQGLDEVVRDAVRRTMIAELGALVEHSERTVDALGRLQRAAQVRALWSGAVLSAAPAVLVALALSWALPSPSQIIALRAQQQQLRAAVARLWELGGGIDLRQCGAPARLCVRVDRRAPSFGEHSDYLVVQGY